MRVLVTGASGFVGTHLCRELVRRGTMVLAGVRRRDAPLPPGVEPFPMGDLAEEAPPPQRLRGITHVIHAAARVHVMQESAADPLAAFRAVNVEGTGGLARAAREAGVARFLFLSSVKVHGEGSDRPYRPSHPPAPADPYGRSKREGEVRLQEEAGPMEWVVVRPPLVYGPGVGGNFRRLLRLAELGARIPLPLGGIVNARSMVYVGNLVDALIHLCGAGGAPGNIFLVADGPPLSTSELLVRTGHAAGTPLRLLPCPTPLLRGAARLMGRGAEADRVLGSLTVDDGALRETGWSPPYTVDEGLAETVAWWRGETGGVGPGEVAG